MVRLAGSGRALDDAEMDRTILNALQRDGRATVGDLAEAVSLSTSPCWRRVRGRVGNEVQTVELPVTTDGPAVDQ